MSSPAGLVGERAEPFRQEIARQTDSGQLLGKLLVPDALAGRTAGEKADRSLALQGVGEGIRRTLADPTPGPMEPIEHASEFATPYHYLLGKVIARAKEAVRQKASATPPMSATPQVVENAFTGRLGPWQAEAVKGRYLQAQDTVRDAWQKVKDWRKAHGL